MKRLILVWMMMLCLAAAAFAESEPEPLFPARGENGKWGYINRQGLFVIPPQFDGADDFRGEYAVVAVYPEGYVPPEEPVWMDGVDCSGVIDRCGNLVLEPAYSFDSGYDGMYYGGKDTGIWTVTRRKDDADSRREGFFDIRSGFFSGLVWGGVYPWVSDSRLIPVFDDTSDGAGYADRTTGELVIPCQFFSVDPSVFQEGVAAVAYMDESGDAGDFFLIDETGAVILLPGGIHAVQYQGSREGRIMIVSEDGLYGFADARGTVVIPPQYVYANAFEDGFAVVQFPEGDWACVDPDGEVLVRGLQADHWHGPDFKNGMYARQTGDQEFSLVDMRGQTVMTFAYENLVMLYPPNENGLCLFATDSSGQDYLWKDRRFGYVDCSGQIVTEPQYEVFSDAPHYENGLALVTRDGRRGYIDREGREVYFWDEDE